MHIIRYLLIFALLSVPISGAAAEAGLEPELSGLELLLDRAIAEDLIAGGVVVVGNRDGILSVTSRGTVNGDPFGSPITERTIFDVASLTKVVATAPAVMKLLDERRISLTTPLSRWFPQFKRSKGKTITILDLLTHTSGLIDFDVSASRPMKQAIRKAALQKKKGAGSSFNYADINFILLGELVQRISGKSLDRYCQEKIFSPLRLSDTMFLPPREKSGFIAPTLGIQGGVVQDDNARRLGSVAGHAGLFSSAYDLARFARVLMSGGVIDGRRVLSQRAVRQMTAPYHYSNGTIVRGLGWDMESPYSAPKGIFFSDASFGHTGYSGSSIWIDPKQDLFVVMLTNRVNYRDARAFNQLRRDVSTIAAAGFIGNGNFFGGFRLPEIGSVTSLTRGSHKPALMPSDATFVVTAKIEHAGGERRTEGEGENKDKN